MYICSMHAHPSLSKDQPLNTTIDHPEYLTHRINQLLRPKSLQVLSPSKVQVDVVLAVLDAVDAMLDGRQRIASR